jgi:5,6-dimethylbenzimidazole synthase
MPSDPSPMSLYGAIRARRDVRAQFTGDPIPDATLRRVLEAGHAAPSVGLTQPWDYILVRDRGLRERFADHVQHERDVFAATLEGDAAARFARIKIDADAGLYSVCLSIQNLWLAATAEGLGVGWVSFYREPFLRDLLGIPADIRPVAWLCVGPVTHLETVPDLERHGWRRRRPLDRAVHLDRWDQGVAAGSR